jgi:O-antigen/teichoic acid export membrane protein
MIIRHTIFNLLGLGIPLVVAVFTIPVLIDALGTAGFGVLTLIWAVVSYFGLFDLGLGRTLTLQLALALSRGEDERVGPMVATALAVMAGLGIAVGGGPRRVRRPPPSACWKPFRTRSRPLRRCGPWAGRCRRSP